MTILIQKIEGAGELDKERVIIRATSDTDIGIYAMFRARARSDGVPVSGPVPNVFWFPDKQVKNGDLVVLYSKNGVVSEKRNENGLTSYFFYWRSASTLWNPNHVPVLVEISDWNYLKR